MKIVYPLLLEAYNLRNSENFEGILFGFGKLNGSEIRDVKEIYNYLIDNPSVSEAFNLWSEEYCLLKVKIPNDIDVIPIDFNDFVKLSIKETNEIGLARMLESINLNYNFNEDIEAIR